MRQTRFYVSTKTFLENIEKIQEFVGNKEIMPVIKANAYGTYINKNLDVLNRFNIVAVAIVDEAIELRKLGYEKDILILNQPFVEEIDDIEKYNLTVGLSEKSFLEKVVSENRKIKVHLEIETGMNRTGIKPNSLDYFIEQIKGTSGIIVEGVYTHFSSADFDKDYTNMQLDTFRKAVQKVQNNFGNIKYIHTSASNGILKCADEISNTVRPGLIMYGFAPFENALANLDVKPICRLAAKISFIKEVEEGESISYSRTFIAPKRMKVATVAIGYADGIRRCLSNKGYVVVHGIKAPIIGNICMDSLMIDVSNIDEIKVDDEVYIWDNNIQTLDDVAKDCNTINYEILSTISDRVVRVFED